MLRLLPLLLLTLVGFDCTQEPPPVVDLVPAEALAAVLPDSVGAFRSAGDEVYRGYFADSMGALALVTVARTYSHGTLLMTLNVSSLDRPDRYRAVVEGGGGRLVPDSLAQADPALGAAAAAGWDLYAVQFGLLLLHADGRVVEAKSLSLGAAREALGSIDLGHLATLAEARTAVDSTFVRAVSRGLAPAPAEEDESEGRSGSAIG